MPRQGREQRRTGKMKERGRVKMKEGGHYLPLKRVKGYHKEHIKTSTDKRKERGYTKLGFWCEQK